MILCHTHCREGLSSAWQGKPSCCLSTHTHIDINRTHANCKGSIATNTIDSRPRVHQGHSFVAATHIHTHTWRVAKGHTSTCRHVARFSKANTYIVYTLLASPECLTQGHTHTHMHAHTHTYRHTHTHTRTHAHTHTHTHTGTTQTHLGSHLRCLHLWQSPAAAAAAVVGGIGYWYTCVHTRWPSRV